MRTDNTAHEPVCVVRREQHPLAAVVSDGAGWSGGAEEQWGKRKR